MQPNWVGPIQSATQVNAKLIQCGKVVIVNHNDVVIAERDVQWADTWPSHGASWSS